MNTTSQQESGSWAGGAFLVWFTGLSGSGKSTLAEALCRKLRERGMRVEHLDGDVVRSFLPQTGFSKAERNDHIRRVAFLAQILQKYGISIVASFISPYEETRQFVRKVCANCLEIYLSTPLEVCERRDVKGLYSKARLGEIKQFTGIDDPYEIPKSPDLEIDTSRATEEECLERVMQLLGERGYL